MFTHHTHRQHTHSQQNSNFELLRFLLIMNIILGRTCINALMPDPIMGPFVGDIAVSTFIVISGFFQIKEKNRILITLCMFVVYYLLNGVINMIINAAAGDSISSAGYVMQVPWGYFLTMVFFCFLTPLIKLAFRKTDKGLLLIILVVITIIYVVTVQHYYYQSNITYTPFLLPSGQPLCLFTLLFAGGGGISLYFRASIFYQKIKIWMCLTVLAALGLLACIGHEYITFLPMIFSVGTNTSFFTGTFAIVIVIIFDKIEIPYNKGINFLGRISLPIFLFYYLFQTLFIKYTNLDFPDSYRGLIQFVEIFVTAVPFACLICVPCEKLYTYMSRSIVMVSNQLKSMGQNRL